MNAQARGRFITFEGVEGAGKTTQLRQLAWWLRTRRYRVRETAEPSNVTRIGRAIRAFFAEAPASEPLAETFLFAAARRQHVIEVLRPALAGGEIVLCDRFTDSTIAYQGYGRGVPLPAIEAINHFATEGLAPDLTVLLDLDAAAGLARLRGRVLDSFEKLDLPFHERVRTGYLELAADEPDRFAVIDAAQAPDDVRNAIQAAVARLGL